MNTTEMKIFENEQFGSVRVVVIDDEPWFVGKDVAAALGYRDTSDALKKHVDSEDKLTRRFADSGQNREMYIINESGVYSLVFSSQLQTAKQFKRWVTAEVLPSIRKHGVYATPVTIDAILADPEYGIRLLMELKEERAKRKAVEVQNSALTVDNQIMRPKADYFDELVDRNTLTNFRETAKQLNVKEKHFLNFLQEHGYIYRDKRGKILPYAAKNDGLFEVKECYNNKTKWAGTQTLITPKGRETFRLLMLKAM